MNSGSSSPTPQRRKIEKRSGDHQDVLVRQEVNTLEDLKLFWKNEVATLDSTKTVIWLDGPLGAGKTSSAEIILGFIDSSRAQGKVSSPTFALHHQYLVQHQNFDSVEHVDLYRIQSEVELDHTGFWDLFQRDRCLILIEWGLRLQPETIPLDWNFLRYNLDYDQFS